VAEPKSYVIFPLGDSAVTIDLGNCIDEQYNIRSLALYDWLQAHRFPGTRDIVMAYSSVSVFFDPAVMLANGIACPNGVADWVEDLLARAWREVSVSPGEQAGTAGQPGTNGRSASGGNTFRIPVCYEKEYAPDLEWVAIEKGLSAAEVIELHCAVIYRVYMVGFLPGFSYMGSVDQRLELPRKPLPVNVVAGGVGLTGRQTGIYPLNSPGGWQIIGRTPTKLFDAGTNPPVRLQSGDRVQFYPVSGVEFRDLSGRPQ
jgi:inhibitor of KinA